jgi:hypothetical protein
MAEPVKSLSTPNAHQYLDQKSSDAQDVAREQTIALILNDLRNSCEDKDIAWFKWQHDSENESPTGSSFILVKVDKVNSLAVVGNSIPQSLFKHPVVDALEKFGIKKVESVPHVRQSNKDWATLYPSPVMRRSLRLEEVEKQINSHYEAQIEVPVKRKMFNRWLRRDERTSQATLKIK